jgi:hypothetical protein
MSNENHNPTRDRLIAYLSAPDVYDPPTLESLHNYIVSLEEAAAGRRNLRPRLVDLRNRAFYIASLDADTELASLGVREEAKAMVASFDDLLGIDGWSDRRYTDRDETAGERNDATR